jgi:cardiolipin synthase A/B
MTKRLEVSFCLLENGLGPPVGKRDSAPITRLGLDRSLFAPCLKSTTFPYPSMVQVKSTSNPSSYTSHNKVQLVRGGRSYFDLLVRLIDGAKQTVHLQTYIFSNDQTGSLVAAALQRAAKRNVDVRVLLDGYASQELPINFIQELKTAGVHFRFFEPLLKSRHFYFGRRLHHKLLVVDAWSALVGGVNISDKYNDLPGNPAWLDFALFAEGEIAKQLCRLCWKTWRGYMRFSKRGPCEPGHPLEDIKPQERTMVRMRRNDWVLKKNQVSSSYLHLFDQAESEILLVSSYFLPGKKFRKYIARAANRGIKVKLILAGISDVSIAKQAERHMYRWLFKHHIEIYEYRPTVLHGKMAICDERWLTVGSYNVNNISAFASVELNLDVQDNNFVRKVKQLLQSIIDKDCSPVSRHEFESHNSFAQRLWQRICYESVGMLFYLFTFYFKQRENDDRRV